MVFLNKFSWTLTTGYGNTSYNHDLEGVYFYQDQDQQFIFSNDPLELGPTIGGFRNWLNNPMLGDSVNNVDIFDVPFDHLPNPVNNPLLRNRAFLADTDTASISFKGVGNSIPITASLHYNYQDFRFGLGFMFERQYLKSLEPETFTSVLRSYQPDFKATSHTRFFGLLGYQFYEYWNHTLVAEVQVGSINMGKAFNDAAITKSLFTTIGISIEQHWSEYFRLVLKPSYEIKSYTINLPDGASVKHNYNTFFIQFGVSINIPEIPRSPMKSDHVQLKHVITDPKSGRLMEVRGQPIWRWQNPKVGQNHRKLWRYKWKNRRKLNPY